MAFQSHIDSKLYAVDYIMSCDSRHRQNVYQRYVVHRTLFGLNLGHEGIQVAATEMGSAVLYDSCRM
jgi:hypothetical protein